MVFPAREWSQATPQSQHVDPAGLRAAIAYMDEHFGAEGARELVIVRNGRLIWKGSHSDSCHEIYSATKVFTSTLLGVLIGQSKCKLDTLATDCLPGLPERYPAYAGLRLRHLASMQGGYRGKVAHVAKGQIWGDPVVYVTQPDVPEFQPAGTQVAYNDHDVHLLGRILATRIARRPLNDLFRRTVAGPIGMSRWDWGICGTVDGMDHCNAAGTPALKGNGGIRTTPTELARLGLLYLNRGNWDGKQVLPASFVDQATTSQVPATAPGRSRTLLSGAYGFYWWTNGVMANGKRRWPDAPPRTYGAHGASTNFCIVVPEWKLVIARMGKAPIPGNYAQQDQVWSAFFARLAAAIDGSSAPAKPAGEN